jgi:prophage antirepressor-like protein
MTSLQLFPFNNQSVRVISIDGDPWFVAQDVLTAIKSTTTVTAAKTVIENELGEEFVSNTPLQTSGGIQDFTIFAEAAITFLVSRSRTAMGKAFNRLLHSEILPTIRKTGKYEVNPQTAIAPAMPQNYIEALEAHLQSEKEKLVLTAANQKLIEANQSLQSEVEVLEPKAIIYDTVMDSDTWLDIRELFKCLAIPKYREKDFRAFLCHKDVKILSKETSQPYANWIGSGLAKLTPVTLPTGNIYHKPVFSWKGCEKIINALRGHGVIMSNHQIDLNLGFKVVKS